MGEYRRGYRVPAWLLDASAAVIALNSAPAVAGETAPATDQRKEQPASLPESSSNTANQGLQEIVVTAQRRQESLQRTPISITAVNASTIEGLSADDISDIGRIAPNAQFGDYSVGSSLFIRGIGQRQGSFLADSGTTMYVDGVYRPRLASNTAVFADLQRLEVLRGPQGTLFGKNAEGGAVNIITLLPSDELGGTAELRFGSRNHIKANVGVDIPVSSTLTTRLSGEVNKQDGYVHNQSGQTFGDTNYYSLKGVVDWKPNNDVGVIIRGDYTDVNQVPIASKLIEPKTSPYYNSNRYEVFGTARAFQYAEDGGGSATVDVGLGFADLKSISAYRFFHYGYAADNDGTPIDQNYTPNYVQQEFGSQELQLTGKTDDGRLNWVAGAFYMDEHLNGQNNVQLGAAKFDSDFSQRTISYALFGQATYSVTNALSLTAGLRFGHDKKTARFRTIAPSGVASIDIPYIADDWQAFTPKFTAAYQFNSAVMAYITASKGFKSGGYNGTPLQPTDFSSFDQESLWSYEGGIKADLFERKLRVNVSVFQMEYSDIQLTIDSNSHIFVQNGGNARIRGLEAEVSLTPVAGLLFTGTFGSNIFKWKYLTPEALALGIEYSDVLGNTSKYTMTGGFQYKTSLWMDDTLTFQADYSWRSRTYFNVFNTDSQSPYGLVSSRLTYEPSGARWSLYAYALNLMNSAYYVGKSANSGNVLVTQGPPREVGVGASVKF